MEWNLEELEYEYGPEITEGVRQILEYFEKRYQFLGTGTRRAVFLTPNERWVVKVPLSGMGMLGNRTEARRYAALPDDIYAKARLHNIMPLGIPVLFMEYLEPVMEGFSELPDWTWGIEMWQVGYDKYGNLKAYDYER